MKRNLPLILAIFFLIGCTPTDSPPTAMPPEYVPTAVALTAAALPSSTPVEASPSLAPSPTPSPTVSPTPKPTLTPTSAPEAPQAAIRMLVPGPLSKVISPIKLKGYVRPGADGNIRVELLGEDGRLLSREIFRKHTINTLGAYVNIDIPFEIRATAEFARLQIITEDEYGRIQDQVSVHLILLSDGDAEINLPDAPYARAVIYAPETKTPIYGGTVIITGEMQPYNENPVIIEIQDEAGKTLGLRVMYFEGIGRQSFSTTISYEVSEQVAARLLIRQADERISGLVYVYSQEILLHP